MDNTGLSIEFKLHRIALPDFFHKPRNMTTSLMFCINYTGFQYTKESNSKAIFSADSPIYLQSLVTLHKPTRLLRSSNDISKLLIQRQNKSYGKRLPSATAADWWNGLPIVL